MNRLDLNAYGVEEMSETQTREVNGGFGLLFFCALAFYVGYMDVVSSK